MSSMEKISRGHSNATMLVASANSPRHVMEKIGQEIQPRGGCYLSNSVIRYTLRYSFLLSIHTMNRRTLNAKTTGLIVLVAIPGSKNIKA